MGKSASEILFDVILASLVSGTLFFFASDIFYYHRFEMYLDLFLVFLILTVLLGLSLLIFAYRNRYLGLTIRKLVKAEEDVGISSYVNVYLNDVSTSDVFGIRKAYNILSEHLRENYIFPVSSGDFHRAIQSILKCGDAHYVSIVKSCKPMLSLMQEGLGRTETRLIIRKEIVSSAESSDFVKKVREVAGEKRVFWRKGSPANVFDVIISLKEENGKYLPTRALKFEAGMDGQISTEYVITDAESLEYWSRYFDLDWDTIGHSIKRPLMELTGAAQIKDTITEICEDYPDLFEWMKETVRNNKANSSLMRAIDELRKSDRYDESKCLKKVCELCKK